MRKTHILAKTFAVLMLVGHGFASAQSSSDGQTSPSAKADLSEAAQYQILLDQNDFSPGSIDGKWGEGSSRTGRALKAFQQANGLEATGKASDETMQALQKVKQQQSGAAFLTTYTISQEDASRSYADEIPDDWEKLAKMDSLSYTSLEEMLGEKFHSDPGFLKEINNTELKAGAQILVPNVENFQVPSTDDASDKFYQDTKASMVEVSGEEKSLIVKSSDGKILYYAPITPGSESLPLPSETLKINALDVMPKYYFDPEVIKEADVKEKLVIAPGPNSPVGIVWIDLSKDGYGLHGTSEPEKIGYTTSHGCVRMTNWDAAAVAKLVQKDMTVDFSKKSD